MQSVYKITIVLYECIWFYKYYVSITYYNNCSVTVSLLMLHSSVLYKLNLIFIIAILDKIQIFLL